ncbi:MAG TPA: acyltransferase [Chitinophagaceae bacterium]|nr:acyltransferase [Chitinophagaceae bacterium]
MNNTIAANPIGRIQKCSFFVDKNGILKIGDAVAISFTAIYCSHQITIQDNVMIGGGTCIYDTDFHPLAATDRLNDNDEKTASGPVIIESNVFIGANCTILKGVTIGNNSIVGACSVVTKSIPPNEIWAGNPAKFIKSHTA